MSKIITFLMKIFPVMVFSLAVILIFFPLPIFIIQALIILNISFSFCLFLSRFIKSQIVMQFFAKLVLFFSMFTCCLAIATARSFLSIETLCNQLPIALTIGQFICKDKYVCGFFTTLMLCGLLMFFCRIFICRKQNNIVEIRQIVHSKLISINNKFSQNFITDAEKILHQKKLENWIDYYNSMGNAAFILLGTMAAFSVLFVIIVAGGTLVGILDYNLPWKESLNRYIMLSSGYLVLFIIPLFLTSLGFNPRILNEKFSVPEIALSQFESI